MNISFPPSFAAADVCKVKSDEIPSIRIYQYSIARDMPQVRNRAEKQSRRRKNPTAARLAGCLFVHKRHTGIPCLSDFVSDGIIAVLELIENKCLQFCRIDLAGFG